MPQPRPRRRRSSQALRRASLRRATPGMAGSGQMSASSVQWSGRARTASGERYARCAQRRP
eukprot:2342486-Alexandrium_andersonii.AAC.1